MLAAEIHLMPDWTVFVQMGVFLLVLVVLFLFVIRPTLRVIDQRRRFTAAARAEGDRLNAEADRLDAERRAAIARAIDEASALRERQEAAAHRDAERVVAEARQEAQRLLDSGEVSMELSEKTAADGIAREAEEIAQEIAQRVMRSS